MRLSQLAETEHAALVLQRALSRNRLHHAFLLCTSNTNRAEQLVRTFFAALNCESENGLDCCENCQSCQTILDDQLNYPELMIFDATQQKLGVSDVRPIEERLSHYVTQGRARAILIRGMHKLTVEAQNCLLKIVEEPPQNTYFFFITSNINGVLLTIRSRCQILRLSPEPFSDQINRLFEDEPGQNCQQLLDAVSQGIDTILSVCERFLDDRQLATATLDLIELRIRDLIAGRMNLKDSPYCYDPDWLAQYEQQFANISQHKLVQAQELLAKGRRYREHNINSRLLGESVLLCLVNTKN